jgi:hypothetical protein
MPGKRLDKVFNALVAGMFSPSQIATPALLSPAARIIIAAGLIIPVVLAEPNVKNIAACLAFSKPSDETKELVKNFCDFAAITFQILIAVMIGGIAVTERVVSAIQQQMAAIERRRLEHLESQKKLFIRQLIRMYVDTRYAGDGLTLSNFLPRTKKILSDQWAVYRQIFGGRLSGYYMFLVLFRSGAAFPGGFYGVIAFFLFEGLILTQVLKSYFDYFPPTCG